jgi:hypothetical protein
MNTDRGTRAGTGPPEKTQGKFPNAAGLGDAPDPSNYLPVSVVSSGAHRGPNLRIRCGRRAGLDALPKRKENQQRRQSTTASRRNGREESRDAKHRKSS